MFRHLLRYMAVVELLGRRKIGYTRDEIIHGLGTVSGGDVTRILSDLEECGFIRKYMPSGQGKNGGMYQLVDSYTLFYFSFVKGNDVRDGEYWRSSVGEGQLNAWRGVAFERVCLAHIAQIKAALGISGVKTEAYSLYVNQDENRRGAQIDLLIDRRDGVVNLCEMKYTNGKFAITPEEATRIRNRIEVAREVFGKRRTIHLTMITPDGIAKNQNSWDVQSEVTLDDLFKD